MKANNDSWYIFDPYKIFFIIFSIIFCLECFVALLYYFSCVIGFCGGTLFASAKGVREKWKGFFLVMAVYAMASSYWLGCVTNKRKRITGKNGNRRNRIEKRDIFYTNFLHQHFYTKIFAFFTAIFSHRNFCFFYTKNFYTNFFTVA